MMKCLVALLALLAVAAEGRCAARAARACVRANGLVAGRLTPRQPTPIRGAYRWRDASARAMPLARPPRRGTGHGPPRRGH